MKTGGRKKGTPNKITTDLRSLILSILERNLETLQDDIDTLTPEKRADIILRLIPYVIPKILPKLDTDIDKVEFIITKGKTIL